VTIRARRRSERRGATGNRLLDALPQDELSELQASLEEVHLDIREALYEQGQPIPHVHFPVATVISLVSVIEEGLAIEVAVVGNEGMAGVPVFLQADSTSAHMAFTQIPGPSLRMQSGVFRKAAENGGTLSALLQRYTQALFSQVVRNLVCSRAHPAERRMARWLLQTHDGVDADTFPLTQEFLSQMLGVTRGTVNGAARTLQSRELIRYTRGKMTIRDRKGLERASCNCYRLLRAEFERLLP
jgi:CRP-like cAMP-binding protein